MDRRYKRTDEEINKVKELSLLGFTCNSIDNQLGFAKETSRRLLKRLNLPFYNRGINKTILIDNFQSQVLIGCLLGDICIPDIVNGNYYFKLTHTVKQSDYFYHKYKLFGDLISPKVFKIENTCWGRPHFRLDCSSKSLTNLKYYRDLFYKPNKVVSKDVCDLITPISIAYWYMDDGSKIQSRGKIQGYQFCTHGFDEKSVYNLIEMFKNKFSINAHFSKTINQNGTKCNIINIFKSKEREKLKLLIEPFVIESMKYKI